MIEPNPRATGGGDTSCITIGAVRPSKLRRELGINTLSVSGRGARWPWRFDAGELLRVAPDGACGFRCLSGAIYALNAAAEARAQVRSHRNAWRSLGDGLSEPPEDLALLNYLRALAEAL